MSNFYHCRRSTLTPAPLPKEREGSSFPSPLGRRGRDEGWAASPGFTLIELLAVLAIIATLLMLAVPRYFSSVDKSKEAVLKENLYQMRDAIGKYYGDKGKYPESVETLATEKYLRRVPLDPVTESATTWVAVPPEDPQKGGVFDVKSGAEGKATDGTAYGDW